MQMFKHWYLIFSICCLVGSAIYGANLVQVHAKIQKKHQHNKVLVLKGEIDIEEKVILRFQSSGKIAWMGVKEGDYVQKNQLLAYLDQQEMQKKLQKYMNSYLKSRSDFETIKDENADSHIGHLSEEAREVARRIVDKAQFDLNNSVLDVEMQNLAVEYSYLYSPIEGIVTSVGTAVVGVNITPAQAEITIINPGSVYFSALVEQKNISKIREGITGKIILDAYTDKALKGTIGDISFIPTSDKNGVFYEAKMVLKTESDEIDYRIGMTGKAEFIQEPM